MQCVCELAYLFSLQSGTYASRHWFMTVINLSRHTFMFWHDRNKVLLLMLYAGRRGQNSECGESRFLHLALHSFCPGTSTSYPRVRYQSSLSCSQHPKFNQVSDNFKFSSINQKHSSYWQQNLHFELCLAHPLSFLPGYFSRTMPKRKKVPFLN